MPSYKGEAKALLADNDDLFPNPDAPDHLPDNANTADDFHQSAVPNLIKAHRSRLETTKAHGDFKKERK